MSAQDTYTIPPDLLIHFRGGAPVAERASQGIPTQISHDAMTVLVSCRDGATVSQVTASLVSHGYDT